MKPRSSRFRGEERVLRGPGALGSGAAPGRSCSVLLDQTRRGAEGLQVRNLPGGGATWTRTGRARVLVRNRTSPRQVRRGGRQPGRGGRETGDGKAGVGDEVSPGNRRGAWKGGAESKRARTSERPLAGKTRAGPGQGGRPQGPRRRPLQPVPT